MACCWALDPEERPKFQQLVQCLTEFHAALGAYVWLLSQTTARKKVPVADALPVAQCLQKHLCLPEHRALGMLSNLNF